MRYTPRAGRRWAAAALTAAVAAGAAPALTQDEEGGRRDARRDRAENVILFVGDGMGEAHRNAARLTSVGLEGDLVMDTLPRAGRSKTDADDPEDFVTDSAAGGTALASGVKTYNGAIGLDAEGDEVQTIIERAEAAGKATGIVTTSQLTDATGASFGAHVVDRSQQTEIARQLVEETGVDVLLGGGEDYWYPAGDPGAFPDAPAEDPTEGSRSDQGNLVERAQDLGYEHVSGAEALAAAQGEKLLGLFANQEMFQQRPEGQGDVYDPVVSLEAMTAKAVEVLSRSDSGFVLVVEEEAVDEFAHANNTPRTVQGVLALDEAVAVGLDAAEHLGDTLVITTADHETGGMAVEAVDGRDESGDGVSAEDGPFPITGSEFSYTVDWTTTGHTNADVPVTAVGPGSEQLVGVYENTHIHDAIVDALFGSGRGR